MKTTAPGITKVLSVLLAGIGISVLATHNAFSQSPAQPSAEPAPVSTPAAQSDAHSREQWRKGMSRVKLPKKGCFKASYPTTRWEEVPCGARSPYPNQPARVSHPDTVGNGTDYEAQVSGLISSAVGEFPSVSPSTVTETGPFMGNTKANAFTLQLNTQLFTTSACGGVSGCLGWQQFIFSQNQCSGPCVFMEYWLLGYYAVGSSCYSAGTCCPPSPWTTDDNDDGDCYYNSASMGTDALTAAELQGTFLMGAAEGGTDTVLLSTTSGDVTAMATDSVLNLDQAWNSAEFNVVGDCCRSTASFGPGTTIVVRTNVSDGKPNAPACVSGGTTGEINNLKIEEHTSELSHSIASRMPSSA